MLHAGGYDGAGSMTNVYDAFAEASKVLAPIAELKFFACDCGRGKDWGKARVKNPIDFKVFILASKNFKGPLIIFLLLNFLG